MRPTPTQAISYGDWMLDKLHLPQIRVPSAPTRPAESESVRVSINDYLRYCRLTQEEIFTDILGSSLWYTDNKRRMVFRILYGTYDVQIASLQQQLRDVAGELRVVEAQEKASKSFLEGTAFANRAAIEQRLAEIRTRRAALREHKTQVARDADRSPQVQRLRVRVAALDEDLAKLDTAATREEEATQRLTELRNQLETQSGRLTRAIVAGETFFDFDFRVCPRCGNEVTRDRAPAGSCYLCEQPEAAAVGRDDLIREQTRVGDQIAETEDLIANHQGAHGEARERRVALTRDRALLRRELDDATSSFVSDHAQEMTERAAELARLEADEQRLTEYDQLFARQEQGAQRIAHLTGEKERLEAELAHAERTDTQAEGRIAGLESRFADFVERIGVPRFAGEPRAAIDRNDYQPIVNGRKIDGLSAGTRVLVNVAHLLAHHVYALSADIPLPGILMIDGMTAHIGEAEYDEQRIENVWDQVLRLHETQADDLQIIMAVNSVPERIQPFVRLTLSPDDRLVPTDDLLRARANGSEAE
jgi:rubrerythrin